MFIYKALLSMYFYTVMLSVRSNSKNHIPIYFLLVVLYLRINKIVCCQISDKNNLKINLTYFKKCELDNENKQRSLYKMKIVAYNDNYELTLLVDDSSTFCDLCNSIFKAKCLDTDQILKVNGTLFNIEIIGE